MFFRVKTKVYCKALGSVAMLFSLLWLTRIGRMVLRGAIEGVSSDAGIETGALADMDLYVAVIEGMFSE